VGPAEDFYGTTLPRGAVGGGNRVVSPINRVAPAMNRDVDDEGSSIMNRQTDDYSSSYE
jgi:hypothetical protein